MKLSGALVLVVVALIQVQPTWQIHLTRLSLIRVARSLDRGFLERVKRQAITDPQPFPVANAVLNVPIPTNIGHFPGTGMVIDKCDRDEILMEDGTCQNLLTSGNCGPNEEILIDPDTNKGFCAPRLCPPDRVFVHSTQLCHDPQEMGICPPGRELYYSAYGTSVCQCPDGTIEGDDDLDDDVCELILGESLLCLAGQVFWFKDFNSPPECLPDPCKGTNLNKKPTDLPFVPSKLTGECFQLGQSEGVCPKGMYYSLALDELKGECETLEDAGYNIFTPEELDALQKIYGPTILENNAPPILESKNATSSSPVDTTTLLDQGTPVVGQTTSSTVVLAADNVASPSSHKVVIDEEVKQLSEGQIIVDEEIKQISGGHQIQQLPQHIKANVEKVQVSGDHQTQNIPNQVSGDHQTQNIPNQVSGGLEIQNTPNQVSGNHQTQNIPNHIVDNGTSLANGDHQTQNTHDQGSGGQQLQNNPISGSHQTQNNQNQVSGEPQTQSNINQMIVKENNLQASGVPQTQNNQKQVPGGQQLHTKLSQISVDQEIKASGIHQTPNPNIEKSGSQAQTNPNQITIDKEIVQANGNSHTQNTNNQASVANNPQTNHNQIIIDKETMLASGGHKTQNANKQESGVHQPQNNPNQKFDDKDIVQVSEVDQMKNTHNQVSGGGHQAQNLQDYIIVDEELVHVSGGQQSQNTHNEANGVHHSQNFPSSIIIDEELVQVSGGHQSQNTHNQVSGGHQSQNTHNQVSGGHQTQNFGQVNNLQQNSFEVAGAGQGQNNSPEIIGQGISQNSQQSLELFGRGMPNFGFRFARSVPTDGITTYSISNLRQIRSPGNIIYVPLDSLSPDEIIHSNKLLRRRKRALYSYATPSNVFESRLLGCRPGASRDINAKCRKTILPSKVPKSRNTRAAPPVPPTPSCPKGSAFNLRRKCVPTTTAQQNIMAHNLG